MYFSQRQNVVICYMTINGSRRSRLVGRAYYLKEDLIFFICNHELPVVI